MARMIVADHEYVSKRYNLHKLKEVEELVAEAVQVFILSSVEEPVPSSNLFDRSTFPLTILSQVSA
jgi:hypothetical protein